MDKKNKLFTTTGHLSTNLRIGSAVVFRDDKCFTGSTIHKRNTSTADGVFNSKSVEVY